MTAPLPNRDREQAHRGLFVAGRGSKPDDGLYRWTFDAGAWHGTHLVTVADLSALAGHPSLPVIYGVSGVGRRGWIHAWDISSIGQARELAVIESQGEEPCHLAVDATGHTLVATNYTSSSLAVQKLAADGTFEGNLHIVHLTGNSIDPERQDVSHPHQAVFDGTRLYVVDLGADLLREYRLRPNCDAASSLAPLREATIPPGTGPRHTSLLPDGRLAISGELASTILVGSPAEDFDAWAVASSTRHTGLAKTRPPRNYPGDIRVSFDGHFAYIANRGYDTISTFAVDGDMPRFISESDSGVAWPQHLLVRENELLVAGWDSSKVVSMPLVDGVPRESRKLFECAGAGWLLPENVTTDQP